jgi:Ring finger domain
VSSVRYVEGSLTLNSKSVSRSRSISRSGKSTANKQTPQKSSPAKNVYRTTNGRKVRDIGSNESTPDRLKNNKSRKPKLVKKSKQQITNHSFKNNFYNHSGVLLGGTIHEMYAEYNDKNEEKSISGVSLTKKIIPGINKKMNLRKKQTNDTLSLNSPHKNPHHDELVPTCCICYSYDTILIHGVLDCKHKFCYDCIVNWSKHCNACPLCKDPFTRIIKQQFGENIDYVVIKQFEPVYGPDGEEIYEVQNSKY